MSQLRIAVIGLGYVGLPLAVALARHFPTTGFDIDQARITELEQGRDRTNEVDSAALRASTIGLTADLERIRGCDVYIVTVPTPVDADNQPDLGPVMSASRSVAQVMGKGAVVVYESTVYPGVTEDICGPELERISGLKCGQDFFLGYSPERINPGDREHTVDRITKVISGQTPEVTELLAKVYGSVTSGGVFRASNIKVAEAAKVIENAQRDINIAFVNEVAIICQRLGISVYDVLDASKTKWNFLNFQPGLVGGHCIGVDPFYLAQCAQKLGHHPAVVLSGRALNDGMGQFIADSIHETIGRPAAKVLVLGLTFKENVPDLRNSKVIDVINGLKAHGHDVHVHDAQADPAEAQHEYGVSLLTHFAGQTYDCVVGAVPHKAYADLTPQALSSLVTANGVIADIKGMWRNLALPVGIKVWRL